MDNSELICKNFRVFDKVTWAQNLTWTSTSQEIVSELKPGTPYDLSIIGIGCKENDTQETDPIQVKTDSFEPAIFQLEKEENMKLSKFFWPLFNNCGLILKNNLFKLLLLFQSVDSFDKGSTINDVLVLGERGSRILLCQFPLRP